MLILHTLFPGFVYLETHPLELPLNKPLSLLGDIWMSELGSTALGTCLVSAFIQQIQRIAIVTVCGQCGSSWKGDRCSSERCSVSGGPVIQAKARYM